MSIIIKTFFLFSAFIIIGLTSINAKDSLSQWFTFLILIIALFVIEYISCIDFKNSIQKNNLEINSLWFIPIIIAFYVVLAIVFQFFIDIQNHSLYAVRYIEKPEDAAWYLIHNGNTTSDTINGMTKDNIESLKERFQPQNQCNDTLPNALHGYMAWNLGGAKVFCPESVDFFDGTDNTEKSAHCLVIEGKYLQTISEYYISSFD